MNKILSRRTILRGAGAAIALPFLDAMTPAFGRTLTVSPKRMLYVYVPTGILPQYWTPKSTGADFDYQRVMKPLEKYRDDVLVMTGLSAEPIASPMADGSGDHARAVASYLTGVRPRKTLGADLQAGTSVDQIAARALGSKTKLSSLELTCESTRTVGECDSYSCAYQTLSYKSETEPLSPEMNPRIVFERMFGDMDMIGAPRDRQNEILYRTSVLDLAMQDVRRVQRDVGTSDRRKLDEYFTCIRDLETRLAKAEQQSKVELPVGVSAPAGVPSDFAEHAQLMFGLIRLAFQTDTTRVATFMLAREGGLRPYPEIGVPEAHHSISHHGNDPALIEKLAKIETYHMEQFAKFVGDLKSTADGTGSMLDHCAISYGAGLADPNVHDHDHCPTLLIGNVGAPIRMGQHVHFKQGTPISNLHLTMLDAIGVPMDKFGNSEGKLDFLTGI
jgi:hypothetical protein